MIKYFYQEYQQQIVETTCVYEVLVETDELVPVEAAWGSPPKYEVIGKRAGEKEKDDIIDVNVAPSWVWGDLQGVDGTELAGRELTEPDLELEGSHLGRGTGYYDQEEMRRYEISSQSVTAWHVTETDYSPLLDEWSGQFHSEETYVVRWKYKVALTGRALQLLGAVGRDRCAYFFWQGADHPFIQHIREQQARF